MQSDLDLLFAAIDQAFMAVSKEHPEAIVCGKGCADCCHAVFDVSLVEAVNLRVHFQRLPPAMQQLVTEAAQGARQAWGQITVLHRDPSLARVRCPLLDDHGLCLCYEARPVNCRTYGIPTVIDGKGHVCGFSGFEPGKSYPTVNLASLQRRLHDLSVQLPGTERRGKRYQISTVILETSNLNVSGAGEKEDIPC